MIDKSKVYRLRSDTRTAAEILADPWVRIYATDGGGAYPVHGAARFNGEWQVISWTSNGSNLSVTGDRPSDLIEVFPLYERWFVMLGSVNYATCKTKDDADNELESMHSRTDARIIHVREVIDDKVR